MTPARVELGREAEWDSLPWGGGSKPQDEADQARCRTHEARKRTQQIEGNG